MRMRFSYTYRCQYDSADQTPTLGITRGALLGMTLVLITLSADFPPTPTPVPGSRRPMTGNKSSGGRRCDNGTLFIERRYMRLTYAVAACACDKP